MQQNDPKYYSNNKNDLYAIKLLNKKIHKDLDNISKNIKHITNKLSDISSCSMSSCKLLQCNICDVEKTCGNVDYESKIESNNIESKTRDISDTNNEEKTIAAGHKNPILNNSHLNFQSSLRNFFYYR